MLWKMVDEDEKRLKLLVERWQVDETLMSGLKRLALCWVVVEVWMRGRKRGNEEALVEGVDSRWNCSSPLRSPALAGLPGIGVSLTCSLISASSVAPMLNLTKVSVVQNLKMVLTEMALTGQSWELLWTGWKQWKI